LPPGPLPGSSTGSTATTPRARPSGVKLQYHRDVVRRLRPAAHRGLDRAAGHQVGALWRQQEMVDQQAVIIRAIMESKNQMVDNVIKMLNAMMATQTKIMAAGMAR